MDKVCRQLTEKITIVTFQAIVGKDKILANFRGSSAKLGLFHFSTGSSAGSNLDETRLNFHPPLLFHQADLSPQFHLALNHGGRGRRRIPLLLFNHRPRLHPMQYPHSVG